MSGGELLEIRDFLPLQQSGWIVVHGLHNGPQGSPMNLAWHHADDMVGEESVPAVNDMPPPPRQRSRLRLVAAVIAAVAITGGGALAAMLYGGKSTAGAELGMLIVQSSPAGVEVFVDGVSRGMTPARVSLPAGSHILELRGRACSGRRRAIG